MPSNNLISSKTQCYVRQKEHRRTNAGVHAVVEAIAVFLCGPQKAAVLRTLANVNPQMQFIGFVERISQRKLQFLLLS